MHFKLGDFGALPALFRSDKDLISDVDRMINICAEDLAHFEENYAFKGHRYSGTLISKSHDIYTELSGSMTKELRTLEEKNNKLTIELACLEGDFDFDVDVEEVSLITNIHFKYKSKSEVERSKFSLCDYCSSLVSYSVGCIMGRYSLDRDGLVYAYEGNKEFDKLIADGAYQSFAADEDGIIPLTDQEWFSDDATNRFREFVKVVWGEDRFQENINFVAESLCLHAIKPKKSESSTDTIRRYLSTQFYKDHLKTYKKRPIYWLFSSGKQKSFECLVYLHRYNEGTLARMRTEYVIPLTSKMATYVQKLEKDKEGSSSAAEVKRIEKEIALLHKQQAELSEFDEKLRHYADQRISLDLDDGVKVNYGKFGDLLAEVKAITGKKPEVIL
jgi:hypothetical protein